MGDALKPVVGHWLAKIQLAIDHKKDEFQDDADECARFLDGPYDWLYSPRASGQSGGFDFDNMKMRPPGIRITINKTAELVQLFGPAIYHRNPVRKVNPRKLVLPPQSMLALPEIPPNVDPAYAQYMQQQAMMQQQMMLQQLQSSMEQDQTRADLLERYLNYTPTALDLKTHSRWAMTEALIKGAGVMITKKHKPPGAVQNWVGTFYTSIDNLQLDPDAECMPDIKWQAIRCCHPVWQVEEEYNLPKGSLKPTTGLESYSATASVVSDPDNEYKRRQGRTADLIVYWKIWSKMGMGGRLSGLAEGMRERLDQVGNFVYLVVADGVSYPLNLPPPLCDLFGDDFVEQLPSYLPQIQQMLQWETPYWADNTWPTSLFAFHFRPRKLWPMSHLKPALGELKFLNWAWSFLAMKVRTASRDFIAIAKAAGQELKDVIKHGDDYTTIEIDQILGSIDQVVKFLQHPGFNPEIYRVIEAMTMQFDKRTGLTELMYGMSARQMRSAQEAQLKSDAINVRPDDMANSAEDTMTDISRKEAFAARWHLTGQDVVRVMGPTGAQLWEQLVTPSDPAGIIYSLEYRIEANSARKPNKAKEAEDMQQSMQMLFTPFWQYAQSTGNVDPVNTLITDWARSIDINPDRYLIPVPPPPPPPPGGNAPEGASSEEPPSPPQAPQGGPV